MLNHHFIIRVQTAVLVIVCIVFQSRVRIYGGPCRLSTACSSAADSIMPIRHLNPDMVQPPVVNFSPGAEYADSVRMFQGIPGLARSEKGRLWACWYGGGVGEGKDNYILVVTSGDDGTSWSNLKLVIDPDREGPVRASEPGIWVDPKGKLWLMWNQYPKGLGGTDSSLWVMTTDHPDDENPRWSLPRLIAYPNMNCFNKPTVLSNGTWLWPCGSWHKPVASRPLFSSDYGEHFTVGGTIAVRPDSDRDFDEYNVVELRDGRLWLLNRTKYGTGESFSSDQGKTWTELKPCRIRHATARHFLTRLASGKLLLVKHGPIDQRIDRSHLTAFVSGDEGKTWSSGFLIDERTGVSYPDGFETAAGVIYIIYDYNRYTDKEILMATFTEDDVMKGETVSGKTRFRVLINKATGVNPTGKAKP